MVDIMSPKILKSMNQRFTLALMTVAIFLISLQSFYFPEFHSATLTLLGSGLLVLIGFNRASQRRGIPQFIIIFIFYFFYIIIVDISRHDHVSTLLAFPFILSTILGTIWTFKGRLDDLSRVLSFVIYIHVAFFSLQAAFWFTTGHYLDFLFPVTGELQSYYSAKGLDLGFGKIPRFCGLYNEPGTFSIHIFTLMVLKYAIDRKIDAVVVLALLAILLSVSLFGFILSLSFIFTIGLSKKSSRLKYFIALIVIFPIIYYLLIPAIEVRLGSEYSGVEARGESISFALRQENLFLGAPDVKTEDILTNDASVFIYTLIHGGVIELFMLFFIIAAAAPLNSFIPISTVFLVLLTKIKLTYPMFWFFLATMYLLRLRLRQVKLQ